MKYLSLVCIMAISYCCMAQSPDNSGFKTTAHGLKYKIIVDAGKPKAKLNDIIKMNVTYSTQRDSVIFSSYQDGTGPIQQTCTAPTFNGDPVEGYTMLGEGDSAIFLMPADSAFKHQPYPPFAKKGDYIKIAVSVVSAMSKEQYDLQKKEEAKMQIEMETNTIEDYLAKNNLKAQRTASGLYYIVEKQGDGPKAEAGKTVTVNYTGKLLNGTVFDSSLKPGRTPFSFPLGQGRVIRGWDEGIALFNVGGKGTLIIPSPLGYGARGAGAAIPPNSILIFDIEVLSVQ